MCRDTHTQYMYKGHKSEGCFNSYLKFLRQQLKSQGAPSDCQKDRRIFRKGTQHIDRGKNAGNKKVRMEMQDL